MGKGAYQVATEASFKESSLLRLSIDKAINKLNWKYVWDIDQTVKETVAWYQVFVNDQSSIYDKTIQPNDSVFEFHRCKCLIILVKNICNYF